jgi:Family of unknown function (DUF5995)
VQRSGSIGELISRMEALLAPMVERDDELQHFHATYLRTTKAVADRLARPDGGGFLDPPWVEEWDLVFADLYLDALERWNAEAEVPGPWRIAFEATRERMPHLRYVLLGMNAHVNYDLPQALLAAITDLEFDDPEVRRRRGADHEHIDGILASRVAAEDRELRKVEGPGERTLLDKLLQPFNRAGTKRFLKEARRKVWANARLLSAARREGPEALAARLRRLEDLSEARVADLRAPGQVILKLARRGFGVELRP